MLDMPRGKKFDCYELENISWSTHSLFFVFNEGMPTGFHVRRVFHRDLPTSYYVCVLDRERKYSPWKDYTQIRSLMAIDSTYHSLGAALTALEDSFSILKNKFK